MSDGTTRAKLIVDGFKERYIANFSYSFSQAIDKDGLTTGIPRGGKITIKVKAMNDGNHELLDWMCDKSLAKKGRIEVFDSTTDKKKMKDIEFEGAYCVDFKEWWEDPEVQEKLKDKLLHHWEEITLTCKKIINQRVEYENTWD